MKGSPNVFFDVPDVNFHYTTLIIPFFLPATSIQFLVPFADHVTD